MMVDLTIVKLNLHLNAPYHLPHKKDHIYRLVDWPGLTHSFAHCPCYTEFQLGN